MKKTLLSSVCLFALGLSLVMSLASPVSAQDTKKKSPSDRTVRVIMGWAFVAVPETVKRDGKVVKLNRENPKDFYIPLEDARRIIRVSARSANANLCGMNKLEARNFLKLMSSEKKLNKWTPDQLIFIQQLHIATGLVMTGSGKAGEDVKKADDAKDDARDKHKCTDEERARIKASIEDYIKTTEKTQ